MCLHNGCSLSMHALMRGLLSGSCLVDWSFTKVMQAGHKWARRQAFVHVHL